MCIAVEGLRKRYGDVAALGFKTLWIFAGALSVASAAVYQALLDVE
jgi:hypothetical protein